MNRRYFYSEELSTITLFIVPVMAGLLIWALWFSAIGNINWMKDFLGNGFWFWVKLLYIITPLILLKWIVAPVIGFTGLVCLPMLFGKLLERSK